MNIYANPYKTMKIHKIHEHVWDMFALKKEHGYIVCSKQVGASHICPPQRNQLLNKENENRGFREIMDFDLQITYKSHNSDENIK